MTEKESPQDRKIRVQREKIDQQQKEFQARQRLIDKLIVGSIYAVFVLVLVFITYCLYMNIKGEPFKY